MIFGILGGIIAGVALGCTKLFDSKIKRLVGIYGSCECHLRGGSTNAVAGCLWMLLRCTQAHLHHGGRSPQRWAPRSCRAATALGLLACLYHIQLAAHPNPLPPSFLLLLPEQAC